jgi:hypothetical protein
MPYIGNAPGQKDIAAYTNIGATPAGSDEVLLSDAGVLKAVTVTNLMAAASGGGKVLQVVIDTGSVQYSTTSSTLSTIDDPVASITPSNSSNKVLIYATVVAYARAGGMCWLDLQRAIASGATTSGLSGESKGVVFAESPDNVTVGQTMVFLDSPSTTSACTYKMMFANEDNSTTTYAGDANAGASIVLMEVDGT